jgi:hypothetical protein
MKKSLFLIGAVLLMAACSSPKYTYNFDHYDYNSGRKQATVNSDKDKATSPLAVQEQTLVASADESAVVLAEAEKPVTAEEAKSILEKKYLSLTKAEKKEFRQEVKTAMKSYFKAKRAGDSVAAKEATKAMDHDLKLAIIFGAVGLTLTFFAGASDVFWILGVIAVVIGVVFLIKWLARQ